VPITLHHQLPPTIAAAAAAAGIAVELLLRRLRVKMFFKSSYDAYSFTCRPRPRSASQRFLIILLIALRLMSVCVRSVNACCTPQRPPSDAADAAAAAAAADGPGLPRGHGEALEGVCERNAELHW
jgi:hypothetical protein